jgi:hypothetical protein
MYHPIGARAEPFKVERSRQEKNVENTTKSTRTHGIPRRDISAASARHERT